MSGVDTVFGAMPLTLAIKLVTFRPATSLYRPLVISNEFQVAFQAPRISLGERNKFHAEMLSDRPPDRRHPHFDGIMTRRGKDEHSQIVPLLDRSGPLDRAAASG